MKKLLTLTLALASLGLMAPWSETKANTLTKVDPQIRIQIGRQRDRYRDRDFRVWYSTEVRLVHDGWRTYRETYQVRHFPDGRTQMVLISRERVRDY